MSAEPPQTMRPHAQRCLLVVSTSARMLVRAARRAGWQALAVDAFGDVDTRASALAWEGAELDPDGGLRAQSVLRAVERLSGGRSLPLVLGSGLESQPWALRELARSQRLAGSPPQVWELLARPREWFGVLDELGIAHPDVAWSDAPGEGRWLAKRAASSGGMHVRELAPGQALPGADWYAQRRIDGRCCSMLFLADGVRARAVGFNRLLPAAAAAPGPFAWSGASAPVALAGSLRGDVVRAGQALTQRLGLRGLCGLDFVCDDSGWKLLELNPRPTATVELWDVHGMPPLLGWHLRACAGTLPDGPLHAGGAHALAVAYASQSLQVPERTQWPAWCRDLPPPGQRIPGGAPLCTVHARHVAPARAAALVAARAAGIERRLLAGPLPEPSTTGAAAPVASRTGVAV